MNCNQKGSPVDSLEPSVARRAWASVVWLPGQARTWNLRARSACQPRRDHSSDSGLLLREEARPRLVVLAEVDQLVGHVPPLRVLCGKAPLAELLQILDLHVGRGQVKAVEREGPLTDHPSAIRIH